jgi:hypothetical protein
VPRKIAYRLEPGSFVANQAQRQGQQAAAGVNSAADDIRVLNNRKYVPLATDVTIGIAAYATLLRADINTFLARGFLIITFTASTAHITNVATTYFQIVLDGTPIKATYTTFQAVPGAQNASIILQVPVRKGAHTVLVQWKTDNTSARINAKTVLEEHAHLLVQEAA